MKRLNKRENVRDSAVCACVCVCVFIKKTGLSVLFVFCFGKSGARHACHNVNMSVA